MRNKFLVAAIFSTALVSIDSAANTFNFGINDDTIIVGLDTADNGSSALSADLHYSRPEGNLASMGWRATHSEGNYGFGLGGKLVSLWSSKADDGQALAIGGNFNLSPADKVTLSASAYFAPSVLTNNNLDGYRNIDLSAGYQLMPTAEVYLAYRDVNFDYRQGSSYEFDRGMYIGAKFSF